MKLALAVSTLLLLVCTGKISSAEELEPAARQVAAAIDSMNVEQHWPAGVHVNWETGVPDGRIESGMGKHTHCSAFVAAAAKRLGIYVLRPPEHGQMLLANAQFDWLAGAGAGRGWQPLAGAVDAQHRANLGDLVLAAYKNRRDDKPGHIAIVRPSAKSIAAIHSEGPEVTQAGGTNYRSTPLKRGFAGHPAAWRDEEVRYYAHRVPDPAIRH
jgi:hypothetical protein